MPSQNWPDLVEYSRSLDCIHCGLCLETCPTYRLTGRESASPRGRIHLMRSLGEGRIDPSPGLIDEIDGCLLCRRCESVCPAGVEFGSMLGFTRSGLERIREKSSMRRALRWLGLRLLLPHARLLDFAASLTRLAQKTGALRLAARALPAGFPSVSEIPSVPASKYRRRLAATTIAKPGTKKIERVFVLEGCLMPVLFGGINRSTVEALSALGVSAIAPAGAGCCGSLHAHNGDPTEAQRLAKKMIEAFESDSLPIVVNSAGCGAHMIEYSELFPTDDPWHARAEAFANRVIDFTRFAQARIDRIDLHAFTSATRFKTVKSITWDDPCHLCHGQNVRTEPRQILKALVLAANAKSAKNERDVQYVELDDSEGCCGSAGIYSLLQPENSRAILESKLEALAKTGADLLVTANPGCQLQWQTGILRHKLDVRVVHIAELIEAAT